MPGEGNRIGLQSPRIANNTNKGAIDAGVVEIGQHSGGARVVEETEMERVSEEEEIAAVTLSLPFVVKSKGFGEIGMAGDWIARTEAIEERFMRRVKKDSSTENAGEGGGGGEEREGGKGERKRRGGVEDKGLGVVERDAVFSERRV